MPPVIHRDVKPENILVDDNLNVYLIDFSLARVGSGSVAMSSTNAGTFGFMAPEQIRNLKLTNASDLYGLGLTLICLIGAIRSTDIGNYIDFSNQLDRSKIDPKLKGCSLTFVKWLDQMVAPDPSKRFTNAKTALKGLQPLYVTRYPSVEISKSSLDFKATSLGEKLSQTITLSNSTPETVLEGRWEVEPHLNDPPHTPDYHAWISFSPKQFKYNQQECHIIVDTSKLIAQEIGTRNILLHTNDVPEIYTFPINIVTAPLPLEVKKLPFLAVVLLLVASILWRYFSFSIWIVALAGCVFGGLTVIKKELKIILGTSIVGSIVSEIIYVVWVWITTFKGFMTSQIAISVTWTVIWSVTVILVGGVAVVLSLERYLELPETQIFKERILELFFFFTLLWGFSLGGCFQTSLFTNIYVLVNSVGLFSVLNILQFFISIYFQQL